MNECAQFEMLLALRDADALGVDDTRRLDGHLDHCDACRELSSTIRRRSATAIGNLTPGRNPFRGATGPSLPASGSRGAGRVIAGRYSIERLIAHGGMGTVCRARDAETGELVAVKLLHDGQNLHRFEREAAILAELRHPRVVRYLGHGVADDGRPFLVMEWLEGHHLGIRLKQRSLSLDESLALVRAVAEGIAAAHALGIIHRDLKPSNLMMPDDRVESVKVVDFGIARWGRDRSATGTGAIVGTPGYMAPEQARGDRDIDERADVFALGCILFQCLTGRAPFAADHSIAVLARILFEHAPDVSGLRAGIPHGVATLVRAMLAKDPAARPRDARAVVAALAGVASDDAHEGPPAVPATAHALSAGEQRLVCVVVAAPGKQDGATLDGLGTPRPGGPGESSREFRIESLADGSVVALLQGVGQPGDQALHAARCAIRIRDAFADRPLALATGYVDLSGRLPVGEVIDRAVRLVPAGTEIALDDASAALLDARFVVDGPPGRRRLLIERELPAARVLLGQRTPFVGRDDKLAAIEAHVAQAVDEGEATAIVVTGPAGFGKSRLCQEFLGRAARRWPALEIWMAAGDVMHAGSPYGLLAPLIRRAVGARRDDPPEAARAKLEARVAARVPPADRQRVAEFLGEIVGLDFPDEGRPQLRAARSDAGLMADHTLRAWVDWIGAEVASQPLLFVFDDLHWGDTPSVRLVDAALRSCSERRLAVIAFARPELVDGFPALWADRGAHELRLGPLSRRAADRLVRAVLGDGAAEERVHEIVERGEGNAFFLEELIRCAAEGHADAPGSVLSMVNARLERLETEARLVLRAGAICGEVFWQGALVTLTGMPERTLAEWLSLLERRELVIAQAEPRFRAEREYAFRHALLRDAAYAMLTEADRELGHRLVAGWLERTGEADAALLAEHLEKGNERGQAVRHWLAAAERALAASDLERASAYAERGLGCGATGELEARLRLTIAEACYFIGDAERLWQNSHLIAKLVQPGSSAWYRALGVGAFTVWMRTVEGRQAALDLAHQVLAIDEHDAVEPERIVAEARIAGALISEGLLSLGESLLQRAERGSGRLAVLEPAVAAELAWPRGTRPEADPVSALQHARRGIEAYAASGNRRSVLTQRANLGEALVLIGAWEEGVSVLESVVRDAGEVGMTYIAMYARFSLARVAARGGELAEAAALLARSVDALAAYALRSSALARIDLARTHLALGALDAAAEQAQIAADIEGPHGPTRPGGLALVAAARLAAGDVAGAVALAREAAEVLATREAPECCEALVRQIFAEALLAGGQRNEARSVVRDAAASVRAMAARLEDERHRRHFLERVPENARILELEALLEDTYRAGN